MDRSNDGSGSDRSCHPSLSRRELFQIAGASAGALALSHLGSAGQVLVGDRKAFEQLIPRDKGLDAKWLESLVTRQTPEILQGWDAELKYVGMPIGGVGCGQLYLGGDGRLWLWDIFKSNYRREPDHEMRISAFTMGGHYAQPAVFGEKYTRWNGADVLQGFALRFKAGGKTIAKALDHHGFPGVTFRGEYPIGKVTYQDERIPVKVQLEAFSPFIPLNAKDSGLPATVMSFTVTNTSAQPIEVDLVGWLQNATCPYVNEAALGQRRNHLIQAEGRVTLLETVEPLSDGAIERRHGYGSMALSLLNTSDVEAILGHTDLPQDLAAEVVFSNVAQLSPPGGELDQRVAQQVKPLDQPLVGALGASLTLEPGESKKLDFAITWYFPNHHEVDQAPGFLSQIRDFAKLRRHYARWFNSADDVATYLADNRARLLGDTRLWNRTWYDSTLPHWFLDRTFLSIDCAATQMLHWFNSGRLYGWEGVDCCPGTCTHVWHYAQGLARIFPELERSFREITDYGIAFHEDSGLIGHRAESLNTEATDGQAGTILRVYREHQMSADDEFLRRLWPRIKKSVQFLMAKDPDRNGLLEGAQPHTLDAAWYGPMAWVSGLYLAAVTAGAAMAEEMGDEAFASQCHELVAHGRKNIVAELFDGEYFIHKPDPDVPNALRTGKGCHIDQVLGQAWAHQVALPRVISQKETRSALESLWRYNLAPDAAGYAIKHREIEQAFRWYAMPGEAGLLMCTWPKGGAKEAIPGDQLRPAKNPDLWTGPGGYFNECMNGFEYQVAAHIIYEGDPGSGLVEKGLAITRAIHERYAPAKRNPYNEIECSEHYARSMASYGVFLAACGFEYHGPQGRFGFAPRITPDDFRAPFTSAEGWGTISQQRDETSQTSTIQVKWGQLRLKTLALAVPEDRKVQRCDVTVGDDMHVAAMAQESRRVEITLKEPVLLEADSTIQVRLS